MPFGQWTITDASLSTDNRFLAYSSLGHIVCLSSTDVNSQQEQRALDFTNITSSTRRRGWRGYRDFAIWSVRFSGDGREIVAGTGDSSVYVYDIERNESILRIEGHDDDVNAVCFGDPNSPHVLYSGSDDCTLKVWDRRSMGDGRAAGVFLGHVEGLTYVDSKGDGRYVISNGKDQCAKLWDLRKIIPTEQADRINTSRYSQGWDYRRGPYSTRHWQPHPNDCSLVTFRGHSVEKTLIRCHFSPPGSSDGRYVYSGSHDGKVYVWNMDATLKDTIDVGEATSYMRSGTRESFDPYYGGPSQYKTVIRDASWHPVVPMIAGKLRAVFCQTCADNV
jgi:WD repeat-containing protein 23